MALRCAALLLVLLLGACGIDGAPVPPPPREDPQEVGDRAQSGGVEITIGGGGYIGGSMRR